MAVREPQTIDTIARSSDGLLLPALTEDRPYTAESAAALAEELRVELTYIYAVKSGRCASVAPGSPSGWNTEIVPEDALRAAADQILR
jgi:hypothetical protein